MYRLVNIGGVNSPFSLNPTSGSLTVQQTLDRETTAQYSVSYQIYRGNHNLFTIIMQFIIEARDSGQPPSATQMQFTLDVTDVNDNPPVFSVSV